MPRRAEKVTATATTERRRFRLKKQATDSTLHFAEVLLRIAESRLSNSAFTRDDLLVLVTSMRRSEQAAWLIGVADTSTHTRYRKVCAAVQHLLATRQLMALDWLRLCLPQQFPGLAGETPPHVLYMETIRRLVRSQFEPDVTIDAMAVIDVWRSDQHVPENLKKMAVRGAFPQLVRESLLRRERYGVFRVLGVDKISAT